jgi:Uma2 family endonuclease
VSTENQATIADLYQVPESGMAEIVDGEIKLIPPDGDWPASAKGEILASLLAYERRSDVKGRAYTGCAGFIVGLPNRRSFSPDVAYYIGPRTRGKFLQGSPVFAVEVRSEGDYGPAAERAMAAKRRDYFAAGTLVVWDADVLEDELIRVYRASDPENPTVYRRGELAEAEPAVPAWTFPVDDLFS